MEQFVNFNLPTYLAILVSACYVLGYFLAESQVQDRFIPGMVLIFTITFATLLTIINENYMFELKTWTYGILYGILSWGTSIGINQTIKQLSKKE